MDLQQAFIPLDGLAYYYCLNIVLLLVAMTKIIQTTEKRAHLLLLGSLNAMVRKA